MAPAPSLSSRRCCRQGPLRTMSPPCPPSIASGSKHRRGGPSKHVAAFPNRGRTPSLTAEASVASGEPQSPIVAPTPSLTVEANVASGEPIDLRAAK